MQSRRWAWACTTLLAIAAIATLLNFAPSVGADPAVAEGRVYELRTYTCNPGKLEDLHARFRDHTNYLFVRHGMTLIGYWTPADGDEEKLVYLIAHASREQAKANWKAFSADPDWQAAYKASHENGVLVAKIESVFLNPTDYSPLR